MSGYSDIEVNQSEGKFIRVKGGESIDIHVLSPKPVKQMIHWIEKKKVVCGGERCIDCSEGDKPKQRWMINVWDRKTKQVRLYEFGPSVAKQIKTIAEMQAEDGKTIFDTDLRIKVEGSGMDSEYTVIPRPVLEPVPPNAVLYEI